MLVGYVADMILMPDDVFQEQLEPQVAVISLVYDVCSG
jgi:hypothetical protein